MILNATDMSVGARFEFTQDQFDFICSDLSRFPIARAVAASSAFPVLLSPLTLRNYTSGCGFTESEWIAAMQRDPQASTRRKRKADELSAYLDDVQRPYLHLLDGGLADNLGARGPVELITALGDPQGAVQKLKIRDVRKLVLMIVNSEVELDRAVEARESGPNSVAVAKAGGAIMVRRYSFKTTELLKQSFEQWTSEVRQNKITFAPKALAAGQISEAHQQQPVPEGLDLYTVEVGFDALTDPAERRFCNHCPTAFKLSTDKVDRLRMVAVTLLKQSESFQKLLRDVNGSVRR